MSGAFTSPWYLLIFLQSNCLELPVYCWGLRKHGKGRVAAVVTLANSITHPVVFFVIMALGHSRLASIAIAETWAVAGETLILWTLLKNKEGAGRILACSLFANLVSWELAPRLTYWLLLSH